ncbi:MAG: peptidoglycan-binding protein [Actinomycetota bacterium]|nr:peptidoglycan-binding protein [Actinomycetota bacterium]
MMGLPYRLGDNGPEIVSWQHWFDAMYAAYAPPIDGYYGNDEVAAVQIMQRNLGLPETGIFDERTAQLAGYRVDGNYTPPTPIRPQPGGRHLALVWRGTGGIIGEDIVSRVCQGAADLVEEINPDWDATMGGLPVGTAGFGAGLSMNRAVDKAFEAGKAAFLSDPSRKLVIGGYSAGAVVAARFRQWLQAHYPENYLCSFSIGDPTRPVGGAFYGGLAAPGRGIGSWRYGDTGDWRHCWLADPDDMYTSVPDNNTGAIMSTAYDIVTAVQLTDPLATAQAIAEKVPVIIDQFLMDPLAGFDAIGRAGRFVIDGTRPHIEYHLREVWPGMTYLGLAVQHVRDYCSRVAPAAIAA